MKFYSPKFEKKNVTLNKILWAGTIVATFLLVYLTGYQGDLNYFLNVDDGSARNTLMTLVVSPLELISVNPQIISYIWLSIAGLFTFYGAKKFSLDFFIYLFLVGPFLLLPSKDGLAFILAMIILMSNLKNDRMLKIIIYCLIIILRPFYGLLVLYLLIITLNKKLKLISYIFTLIFLLIFLFSIGFLNKDLVSSWLAYTTGYFKAATEAGSTDWLFINNFDPEVDLLSNSLWVIARAFFPFWMVTIGSLTAWAYFSIYGYCIYYGVKILRHHYYGGEINNSYFKILCILGLVLIPAAPILVVNGGSAARYISLLPSICLLLSRESK